MANYIFLVSIFILGILSVRPERILFYEQNPGCNITDNDYCNNTHIVHIQSDADNMNQSTYHNLWIFSNGYKPAIILFETEPTARLVIDWSKFFQHENNDSIFFQNGIVRNSFGFELSDLFIVNMTSKQQLLYNIPIHQLNWSVNFTERHDNRSSIEATFFNNNNNPKIGNFRFHLKSSGRSGREKMLPKLIYSEAGNLLRFEIEQLFIPESLQQNSTQLQICANLTTILDGHRMNSHIEKYTSMDDEYTPGVFHKNSFLIKFPSP
ncbi:hypothetical protein BLA29_000207 [Euroglyphus maynei]|uniref:Uncharacterized protein n=1 Tax=Euroglyphus maynei TaxID=6958 RepID=A0A1Y3B4J9_EURMA|nr:hypothetical protein BLA29_000207 [Euroglyphus maynei]